MNNTKNNSDIILELKYDQIHDDNVELITNNLPFRLTKSSKYVSGIDYVGI